MIRLNKLCTVFTAVDKNGNKQKVNVIFEPSLYTVIKKFEPDDFPEYHVYLEGLVSTFEEFLPEIHDITWYTCTKESVNLTSALQMTIDEGNKYLMVEFLDR